MSTACDVALEIWIKTWQQFQAQQMVTDLLEQAICCSNVGSLMESHVNCAHDLETMFLIVWHQ